MALPQTQQNERPSSNRQRLCDITFILVVGLFACTCLSYPAPPLDDLTPSSPSACNRRASCHEVVKACALHPCAGGQVTLWKTHSWGFLYADAAAPAGGGGPARPGYRAVVKNEVVANLAGVPVELFVKDVWHQLFHKMGRKYWVDLLFWLRGYFLYKDARKVAIMITRELQMYLYDEAPVNESAWKATRRQLEEHLREWWVTCPEDPYRALTAGVWKALVNVYVDLLEPALRGSPKLKELENLLFDPELKVIRSWTDAAHLNIVRGREEEIVAKLDTLARERPREKALEQSLRLPLATIGLEEPPVAPEHGPELVTPGPKASRSGRARLSAQERHSKKSKAT